MSSNESRPPERAHRVDVRRHRGIQERLAVAHPRAEELVREEADHRVERQPSRVPDRVALGPVGGREADSDVLTLVIDRAADLDRALERECASREVDRDDPVGRVRGRRHVVASVRPMASRSIPRRIDVSASRRSQICTASTPRRIAPL